jgi:hypothetical protein
MKLYKTILQNYKTYPIISREIKFSTKQCNTSRHLSITKQIKFGSLEKPHPKKTQKGVLTMK